MLAYLWNTFFLSVDSLVSISQRFIDISLLQIRECIFIYQMGILIGRWTALAQIVTWNVGGFQLFTCLSSMRRQTNIFSQFSLTTHQIFKGASLRVAESVLTWGFFHLSLWRMIIMWLTKRKLSWLCVGFFISLAFNCYTQMWKFEGAESW